MKALWLERMHSLRGTAVRPQSWSSESKGERGGDVVEMEAGSNVLTRWALETA